MGAQKLELQEQIMSKQLIINKKFLAWKTVDWALVEQRVNRVQRRLYKASLSENQKLVHWLQKNLINSIDAKLLAVRQVTTLNKGRNTMGTDRKLFTNNKQKEFLVRTLRIDGKAEPIRRVWIPKPGKKEERPLGIPTIRDRAKQVLAKLALEPEWEARFEPNSYGFRPGRRAHDAIEAIFLSLHHKYPKWVYDADIKKCFDRINHDALLNKIQTFPEMRQQISAWLKADIMEGYANNPESITPSTQGTPQGGTISPLLANIALHGLEFHLKVFVGKLKIKPRESSNRGIKAKESALSVIRFADDFVLIHVNKKIMDLCIIETSRWLSHLGLQVSEEKSVLRYGNQPFLFLGFQIVQVISKGEYKVKIIPNKENRKGLLDKVRNIIQNNKAISSYKLICMLRPIILGWANYFKYSECSKVFNKMGHLIFQKLRAWVFRRDTRNGRIKIKEKYFPKDKEYSFGDSLHKDNWILCGQQKHKLGLMKENHLPSIAWVKSEKFIKIKGAKSPYDGDYIYWTLRIKSTGSLSIQVRTLLRRQNAICPICKKVFTCQDKMEVDHIIPQSKGGADFYSNKQLLHRSCHILKTANELSVNTVNQETNISNVY